MISKELLSEVLGKEILNILKSSSRFYFNDKNNIGYEYFEKYIVDEKDLSGGTYESINIYELAHKYKKWAYNKGYEIIQSAKTVRVYKNKFEVYHIQDDKIFNEKLIFQACEWIKTQ